MDKDKLDAMQFLSTPSARRATLRRSARSGDPPISIHALREEGDAGRKRSHLPLSQFLSTPSARRATASLIQSNGCEEFLSTPSARRATLLTPRGADVDRYFYPRPPRGGRLMVIPGSFMFLVFLSTPSARRATLFYMQGEGVLLDFYPRPPRGGRLVVQQRAVALKAFLSTPFARRATDLLTVQVVNLDISIHALREEGDSVDFIADKSADISIHALREEGDKVLPVEFSKTSDFYPRPPRGGRPQNSTTTTATSKFLSTPSARRATGCAFSGHRSGTISIHALREEGDVQRQYVH